MLKNVKINLSLILGIPEQYHEAARNATVKTEIKADGDNISITRIRPQKTNVHNFKLGEASEVETPKGDKVQVIIHFIHQVSLARKQWGMFRFSSKTARARPIQ